MNRRLLIRADASPEIGFGHLMRCHALGQYWRRRIGPVHVVSNDLPDHVLRKFNADQIEVTTTPADNDQTPSEPWLSDLASQWNADVLLIDGYQFDDHFQKTLFHCSRLNVVLDDYRHASHQFADAIVNVNVGATSEQYADLADKLILAGNQFALLRDEFLRCLPIQVKVAATPSRLLVTFGGSDPVNATTKVAAVLQESPGTINKIRIILGPGFKDHEILHAAIGGNPMFEIIQSPESIVPHYQWADLAICAGGGSHWELSLFGVPRFVIPIVSNQQPGAEASALQGCCDLLQWDEISQLPERLSQLSLNPTRRHEMMVQSQKLIDGLGSQRICEAIVAELDQRNLS